MKKVRRILLNTGIYFVYFLLSCILTMLVEAMLLKFLDRLIATSYLTQTILRLVIYSVGVPALIGAAGYFEGLREAEHRLAETTVSGILASLLPHLLIALLFHFKQFCAGAVPFLVGLLRDGADLTPDSILFNDTGVTGLFLAVFAGYGLLYSGVLTACRYIGVCRRHAQRAEMGFTPDGKGRIEP